MHIVWSCLPTHKLIISQAITSFPVQQYTAGRISMLLGTMYAHTLHAPAICLLDHFEQQSMTQWIVLVAYGS